jgi:hypothetical protein
MDAALKSHKTKNQMNDPAASSGVSNQFSLNLFAASNGE